MSNIFFLHQTTTTAHDAASAKCCQISFFYIKPQPIYSTQADGDCCQISFFYIKPQPIWYKYLLFKHLNRKPGIGSDLIMWFLCANLLKKFQLHWDILGFLFYFAPNIDNFRVLLICYGKNTDFTAFWNKISDTFYMYFYTFMRATIPDILLPSKLRSVEHGMPLLSQNTT